MRRLTWTVCGLAILAAATVLIIKSSTSRRSGTDAPGVGATIAARLAHADRLKADNYYASADPKLAINAYSEFITNHEQSSDPEVQDEVSNARIRIGYVLAKNHDYDKARTALLVAEKSYKGTGERSPDFGGLKDQAAYQAAVCLVAAGKTSEAKQAFRKFFHDYELSPLVHAAHRRLVMLSGGKPTKEIDSLLEAAVEKQQKMTAFEMSTCGPKAIQRMLSLLRKESGSYEAIAKLCGTSTQGTTLEGMQKGLSAFGVNSFGYELTEQDFVNMPLPAIWLSGDHYVVVERFENEAALVYDPLAQKERQIKLFQSKQPNFSAVVLTTSKMNLEEN